MANDDMVKVCVTWTETRRYTATVAVPRSAYERDPHLAVEKAVDRAQDQYLLGTWNRTIEETQAMPWKDLHRFQKGTRVRVVKPVNGYDGNATGKVLRVERDDVRLFPIAVYLDLSEDIVAKFQDMMGDPRVGFYQPSQLEIIEG
jgi:hypothetical protein